MEWISCGSVEKLILEISADFDIPGYLILNWTLTAMG